MKLDKIQKLYHTSTGFLKRHKLPPQFMSHGVLHLVVLFLCLLILGFLSWKIYSLSHTQYRIAELSIGFSSGNERPLNMVKIEVTPSAKGSKLDAIVNHDIADSSIYNDTLTLRWRNYAPDGKLKTSTNLSSLAAELDRHGIVTAEVENGFDVQYPKYSLYLSSQFTTSGEMLFADTENPNSNFYLKLNLGALPLDSVEVDDWKIIIDLGKDEVAVKTFNHVYPTPTYYGIGRIEYNGRDVFNVIKEGGVYIDAEDNVKAKNSADIFLLYSVLAGTLIAFIIDIVVILIYKWRRL